MLIFYILGVLTGFLIGFLVCYLIFDNTQDEKTPNDEKITTIRIIKNPLDE